METIRQEIVHATNYQSVRSIALEIGTSVSNVYNLIEGAVPRKTTLIKLREWRATRGCKELPEPPPPVTTTSGRTFARGKLDRAYISTLERWAVFQVWRFSVLCADMHSRRFPEIGRQLGISRESLRRFLAGEPPHETHFVRLQRFRPAEGVEPDPAVITFGVFLSQLQATGIPADEGGALQRRILNALETHCSMNGVSVPGWVATVRTMLARLSAEEGIAGGTGFDAPTTLSDGTEV